MPSEAIVRRPLVVAASLALMISGCASQPSQPTRNQTPGTTSGTQHGQTPDKTQPTTARGPRHNPDTQSVADTELARSRPDDDWPDPETDLWSQIHVGFELQGNEQRPAVREWTQFYATHQKHLQSALERARPFLYHIVHQVEARGMPTELALLPLVESGYNASARSYAGASGLWQFMPGTADHMGLARDWWYDGRNDVIASTRAALDYLDQLHARYSGNWLLALAAYNAGPGRVDSAIARARSEGRATTYWKLELPRETTEYVPKLLAVRRIMRAPSRFGIQWPELDNTPRTRSVTLPGQTELSVAANMLDMPETRLRRLNPGMRRWATAPAGDYKILVPAAKADGFRAQLAATDPNALITRQTHTVRRGDVLGSIAKTYGVSIAALRQANHLSGDHIRTGQSLQIPRSGAPGKRQPSAEPTRTYVVQAGDNLWDIAQRYKIEVAGLKRANGGLSTQLQPGQTLVLPGAAGPSEPSTHVVQSGDSLWSIANDNDIATADLRRWNRLGEKGTIQPGQSLAVDGPAPLPDYYEVEPGDSLWTIANRFSMQVATLRSLNEMSSGSTIQPGERLRLQPAVSG